MSFSMGSFRPRGQTWVSYISCIGRWVLYHQCHLLLEGLVGFQFFNDINNAEISSGSQIIYRLIECNLNFFHKGEASYCEQAN